MSNERDHRSGDRLADTYRAVAKERAPNYLNEKVLRLAAGTRTRYSRARAWMRPAAWAAVIGLSLAIVLDMTRLPQVEPDSIGTPVTGGRKDGDQRRQVSDTVDDNGAAEAEAIVSPSAAPIEKRTDSKRIRPASSTADSPVRRSNEDFVPKDMTVLRDAEEMARARAGSDQGPIPQGAELREAVKNGSLKEKTGTGAAAEQAVIMESRQTDEGEAEHPAAAASLATMAAPEPTASDRHCGESMRKSPESWIACIRQLEKNGQEAEAREEYEEFRQVFPDFDVRDADK